MRKKELERENALLKSRAALADKLWGFVDRAELLITELRWNASDPWVDRAKQWLEDFEEGNGDHLDGPCLNPACDICHVERHLEGGDLYDG